MKSFFICCNVLNVFNQAEQDAGRPSDWYVPACGQLALIYLAKDYINAALAKIGGTAFSESSGYWSSSEYNSQKAWEINFNTGEISMYRDKSGFTKVRFIRDIE